MTDNNIAPATKYASAPLEAIAKALVKQRNKLLSEYSPIDWHYISRYPDNDWYQFYIQQARTARLAVIEECIQAIGEAAWKHEGDDAYSKGMDQGARHQVDACIEALRSLKGETDAPA